MSDIDCDLCPVGKYQNEDGITGRFISKYNIAVCSTCYHSAFDGWGPIHETVILDKIKIAGLPLPERNEKGWLPRD